MVKKSAKKLATSQRSKWLEILETSAVKSEAGNYRVIIDSNVWISGILYGGKPESVIRFCKHHCFITISDYIISEVLQYLKKTGAPYKWRNSIEKLLKRMSVTVETQELPKISRDPKDDPIIAAAVIGNCNFIITGDDDLLELRTYRSIQILNPSGFLELPKIKETLRKP